MGVRLGFPDGAFGWIDLQTGDVAGAKRFYGELLGWTSYDDELPTGGAYTHFLMDGHEVAGIAERARVAGPPAWTSFVMVEDVELRAAAAGEHGGRVLMGPVDVLDAGRVALCTDPEGARFGLWEAGRHTGAGLVDEPGAPCWHELMTHSADAAEAFYAAVFGWSFAPMEGVPLRLDVILHGSRPIGAILELPADDGYVAPQWDAHLGVADADDAIARLVALGGSVLAPPFETPLGRTAFVADPEGATFSLIALRHPVP